MKKKISLFLSALVLILSLSGCSVVNFEAGDLMTPPKSSGGQAEIQKLIEASAGGDFTLVFPLSGERRSSIIIDDIDGDSLEEAAALYTVGDGVTRLLFSKKENGSFAAAAEAYIPCDRIDRIDFSDVDGDGEKEVLVGYQNGSALLKSLAVFDLGENVTSFDTPDAYAELVIGDFDRDGADDVLALVTALGTSAAKARLLSFGENGFFEKSACELDSSASSVESVRFGLISEDAFGAAVDASTAEGIYTTQIVCYDASKKALLNPLYVYSGYALTFREAAVFSRDEDGDGVLEIPLLSDVENPGSGVLGETVKKISWESYDFSRMAPVTKKTSVLCPDGTYMLTLSDEKAENLTAGYDPENRALTLYAWGSKNAALEPVRLLTVTAVKKSDFDETAPLAAVVLKTGTDVYTYTIENEENAWHFSDDEVEEIFELI